MTDAGELTVRIEETDAGGYRARVAEAPERHFAAAEDPLAAARGALSVVRETVDATVGHERSAAPGADRGEVASE